MTEEIELTKGQKYIACVVIGLIIGAFGTYYLTYKDKTTPDEVIDLFEKSLFYVTKVRPGLINEQSKVGELQDIYIRYKPLSTQLLKIELSRICGGDWIVDPLDNHDLGYQLDSFCVEVCSEDI